MQYHGKCPSCGENSISIIKLSLLHRLTCLNCKSKIGFNWIFSGIFYCFSSVFLGFLGLNLLGYSSVTFKLSIFMFCVVSLTLFAGFFAPLETKQKWWEP